MSLMCSSSTECTLCGAFGNTFTMSSHETENYEGCPTSKMPKLQKLNLAHVFHWNVIFFSIISENIVPFVPPLHVFKNSRVFYPTSSRTLLWTVPMDDFNAGDRSWIVSCWFPKISYSSHPVFFSICNVLVRLMRSSSSLMSTQPS